MVQEFSEVAMCKPNSYLSRRLRTHCSANLGGRQAAPCLFIDNIPRASTQQAADVRFHQQDPGGPRASRNLPEASSTSGLSSPARTRSRIADVRRLLDPAAVADRLRTLAPFTISYLHVFTASPNRYRKDLARKAEALERRAGETSDGEEDVPPVGSEPVEGAGGGGHSEGIASDPFADTGPAPEDWRAQYLGFTVFRRSSRQS
ncbi:uncharacterized protein B0H18DRAFT_1016477, partial [Fomitopsis serialis]|uniref:uncharacterized protein n=1 Tax=Fomitopsis serialis TaxID=139415 RepID=UPI00200865FE